MEFVRLSSSSFLSLPSILQKEFVLEAVHSRADVHRQAMAEGLQAWHKEGLTTALQALARMEVRLRVRAREAHGQDSGIYVCARACVCGCVHVRVCV